MFRVNVFFLPALLVLFLIGCIADEDDEVFTPKPRAYFSIEFPPHSYRQFDSVCPFTFEYPKKSFLLPADEHKNESCWMNIHYPQFKAKIHISYKAVNGNLANYIEDARELAIRHQIKASGLEEQVIIHDSVRVFGLLYDIAGNTATNLQFYVTDSTRHFVRGSLYFNCVPNIDSLKVVVDYIRQDMLHLMETFRWKK